MNAPNPNPQGSEARRFPGNAEDTLRLLASLPAPAGLEERIHAGLRTHAEPGRVLRWRVPMHPQSGWLRGAAAAAIVCVVVGGSWSIAPHGPAGQSANTAASPAGVAAQSGFSSAGAIRTPHTLDKPAVAPAAVQPAIDKDAAVSVGKQKTKRALKKPAVRKLIEPAK